MKYNFDEPVKRRGTGSVKWDTLPNDESIPMWVADMDFKTAPVIIDALRKRVDHGVFGYTYVMPEYYDAIINWFSRKHDWKISRESIIYIPGVVPALSAIVKAMVAPGEKVIIQTPVYNCFFSSIRNNGCEISENRLIYANRTYTIDFDDLEAKASDPDAKLLILCNPQNPGGRVWTREELTKVGEICFRHNVAVLSDEIHCELTLNGNVYTPFASISEEFAQRSISCVSPSKAFNTAGLQIANIIVENEEWREAVDRAININEVCDVNPFGVAGLMAAYNNGEEWLEQLKLYLWENYESLVDFFEKELPEITITRLEGTYLVWADCRRLPYTSKELEELLLSKAGVRVNAGTFYGSAGEGFLRINIACPRSQMLESLKRMKSVLHA